MVLVTEDMTWRGIRIPLSLLNRLSGRNGELFDMLTDLVIKGDKCARLHDDKDHIRMRVRRHGKKT